MQCRDSPLSLSLPVSLWYPAGLLQSCVRGKGKHILYACSLPGRENVLVKQSYFFAQWRTFVFHPGERLLLAALLLSLFPVGAFHPNCYVSFLRGTGWRESYQTESPGNPNLGEGQWIMILFLLMITATVFKSKALNPKLLKWNCSALSFIGQITQASACEWMQASLASQPSLRQKLTVRKHDWIKLADFCFQTLNSDSALTYASFGLVALRLGRLSWFIPEYDLYPGMDKNNPSKLSCERRSRIHPSKSKSSRREVWFQWEHNIRPWFNPTLGREPNILHLQVVVGTLCLAFSGSYLCSLLNHLFIYLLFTYFSISKLF